MARASSCTYRHVTAPLRPHRKQPDYHDHGSDIEHSIQFVSVQISPIAQSAQAFERKGFCFAPQTVILSARCPWQPDFDMASSWVSLGICTRTAHPYVVATPSTRCVRGLDARNNHGSVPTVRLVINARVASGYLNSIWHRVGRVLAFAHAAHPCWSLYRRPDESWSRYAEQSL